MKKHILLALLIWAYSLNAQIKGSVTDPNENPIPFVNIYIENTYIGTTSNEQGKYELVIPSTEKQPFHIIFQYLGYKTQKITITATQFPYYLDVKLQEENYNLKEVVVSSKDNPAHAIIRNAIAHKTKNSEKTARFTADFYSRGIFRLKNAPKKILGKEVGDFNGALDSTGSGILYLSETVSKITFEKPNKLKENIIASKISGNDNGFSYNTAQATSYDFYENNVEWGINMISPIADNAFFYYKFNLEGTFYDENNNLINKIKITPKRDAEPVFEGYLYIVEDSWAIYGMDLETKGYRMKEDFVNTMNIKQNFSYNTNNGIWAKNTQSIAFDAGAFGITFTGKFTYVYSNYEFKNAFEKKTFTREILRFEDKANLKDTTFWNRNRPVPLTEEESLDYIKKDSLQTLRKSQKYLDSLDLKRNKFGWSQIITGYSYTNSFKNWRINYDGILTSAQFNTVQGWNLSTGISYSKRDEKTRKYSVVGSQVTYGFAEEKWRATAYYNTRISSKNNSFFSLSGGSKTEQFNPNNPISDLINTVSTLFFKDNYAKFYEKNFIKTGYQQELVNGLYLSTSLEYSERKPLQNTTDQTWFQKQKPYTSNNPLNPTVEGSIPFEKHNLIKFNLNSRINWGQKYLSRPDGKFNIPNSDYPTLWLGYEMGFAGNEDQWNYSLIMSRLFYEKTLGNKGTLAINLKAGKFFNAETISFADFKHFNGNQTRIGTSEAYLSVFNLMPYYQYSTNNQYFETHLEHNFEGYIMNKIPLLNKLKSTLVLGYHQLAIPDNKPYQEFTIGLDKLGFGKFKVLRLDYSRSYSGSHFNGDGIIIGLKFLNIIN